MRSRRDHVRRHDRRVTARPRRSSAHPRTRTPRRCSPRARPRPHPASCSPAIPGTPPGSTERPAGCADSPRCPVVIDALPARAARSRTIERRRSGRAARRSRAHRMTTPILTAQGASLSLPDRRAASRSASATSRSAPAPRSGSSARAAAARRRSRGLLVGALAPCGGTRDGARGASWSTVGRRDPARRSVQMIFQDPYASLNPWLDAAGGRRRGDRALGARPAHGMRTRARSRSFARSALPATRSAGAAKRLSGGQCQRVGIARALACRPAGARRGRADVVARRLRAGADPQPPEAAPRRARADLVLISHDLAVVRY